MAKKYGTTLILKNYIDGKWVFSENKKTFNSINPAYTDDIVAKVPQSDYKDIDKAVKAAKEAFQEWRLVPAPKRGEILFEVAQKLKDNKNKLGDLVGREMGKQKKEAYGDVQEAIDMGFFMAGEGRRAFGEVVESELKNKLIKTIRQPVGVFGLITPWNFPTAIPCWKIFPALIYGNTVVFKPSQYTSACAQKVIEIFDEVFQKHNTTKGILNLVHGKGSEAGNALINHKNIDGISFTGSTAVGKKIAEILGPKLKKCSLEMGGKNVIIVMDDSDLDLSVEGSLWAGFGTTGQRCTAASRILVHEHVYDKFTKMFVEKSRKLKLGYALDKDTDVGPLINEDAYNKVKKYIATGRMEGKLLCGGKSVSTKGLDKGYFIEPTIFGDVKANAVIAQEEIFGPVVALIKVKNLKHAIDVANNAEYGLSSSIFTSSIINAEIASRELQTGLVYINTSTIGAEIQTPFGGLKNSGNGHREAGGRGGAIDTYTNVKVISSDFSGKIQKAQID